jgi:hypothetical protein
MEAGLQTAIAIIVMMLVGAFVGYMLGVYLFCEVFKYGGNLCGLPAFITGPLGAIVGGIVGWRSGRRSEDINATPYRTDRESFSRSRTAAPDRELSVGHVISILLATCGLVLLLNWQPTGTIHWIVKAALFVGARLAWPKRRTD